VTGGVIPVACRRDARPPSGRQTMGLFDALTVPWHGEAQATGMTSGRGAVEALRASQAVSRPSEVRQW
jgi:hypothetical protein